MGKGVRRIIILFVLFSALTGLTGVCSCAADDETEDTVNESLNLTRIDWTSMRNANKTLLENLQNLNVSIKNPEDEKKIDYITGRVMEEINRSFSYETSDAGNALKRELFFIIRDPAYEYNGPAALAENFSVTVFKTIADPLISKPSYLSREYIVRYNITFVSDSSRQRMENTIWWYESDASGIVDRLLDSSIGDNIAVIAITFNDATAGGKITFVLEAEDLEKLIDYREDGDSYIRYFDWSDTTTDKKDLVYYEEPSSGIDIPVAYLSEQNPDNIPGVGEELRKLMDSRSFTLMEAVDSIGRSVSEGDFEGTMKTSGELIGMCRDYREEIESYPVDDRTRPLIEEYTAGLAALSRFGSHYWHKSLIPGEMSDDEINEVLDEGVLRINSVLLFMELEGYDTGELEIEPVSVYSDYLPSGTAFHYRDAKENNDISIKITGYCLKSKLLLKKGTTLEYQEASYGKRYLGVVVDIMHLGYRGGGTQKIVTPPLEAFVLYYEGDKYLPSSPPDYYISNMGEVYRKATLNRLQRYESLILFEIDDQEQFEPEKAYVEVDLGDYGKQMWCLSAEI